jgi:hypothetical protein
VLPQESWRGKQTERVVQRVKKVLRLRFNWLVLLTAMKDRPFKRNWLEIRNLLNFLPALLEKKYRLHLVPKHRLGGLNG